jgi:serine/threonine protein kinase/Tfp pilus assembly protein PilF
MDEETRSLSGAGHGESPELRQWGPFELRQRVGQGGFGEVYHAFDPTLQREVAVKLLLRGARQEQLQAAILREARAMARITHPNIVPIYGVKEYDGRFGMWSAFVRGRTLADLLKSNGPFGAQEAILIGVDLCRALSAVHAAGLLHGDIKSRNAMREEGGRILLMDFGLTQERGAQGVLGGTPGYIAPELRGGEKATARSDVYALGVLLYHLLTGRYPPEEGATWNLLELRPDLPPALVRTIHRAIDPDPERRFSSAAHMAAALSDGEVAPEASRRSVRPWYLAAAVAVLAVGGYLWLPHARNAARPDIHQRYDKAHDLLQHYYRPGALNAVIPMLESITHDDPAFAAGFADLGRANFQQFWVLRDARYVEPASKASLDAIALDANQASPHVTLAMLYTQTGKNDLATQELDTALRIDRLNAEAWGARAELYKRQGRNEDVEPALRKAIDLAPSDWRWHTLLADLYSRTGRIEQAIAADQEAVRLALDNSRAYNNLGLDLYSAGRLEEARTNLQKAIALEPAYNRYSNLGMVERELGDYAAASEKFQKAIALNPGDYRGWGLLADIYRRGHADPAKTRETYEKSIALAEELLKTKPKEAFLLSDIGGMYASIGNSEKSVPMVRQAAALEPENGELLFKAGVAYELVHRRGEAIQWIGSALRHGYSRKFVERAPELAALRSDKNYLALTAPLR